MFVDPRIERLSRQLHAAPVRKADIRSRFAEDPAAPARSPEASRDGSPADHPARSRDGAGVERDTAPLREAAVALLVRPREALEILLIRRAELHGDPWSGHVALPGGRRAPGDAALFDTACRETEEEVGIPLDRIGHLIGALDEVAPSSAALPPLVIAPFVVAVPPDTHAHPDPREVQAAVWVPLDALRDPGAISEITVELPDSRRAFPSIVYADYEIWGLTHAILRQFLERQ